MGTTHFLITSDGEFVNNPRHFQNAMKKLRVAQRSVSRKTNKRSNTRRKAVRVVAKLHRKVSRQRLDFHHKQARKLVNENDLIAHENLNVGGMGRGNLARSIHDVGWSQFFQILAFKAECAGKRVVAVDPRYTSQKCNACGHTEKANRVNQAKFVCRSCGHTANADHNAALNILGRADPLSVNVAISSAHVA
ncbi:RNA-guided endonuclease InsQ/TnpB family protein [Deinococcus sp. UYEF24]